MAEKWRKCRAEERADEAAEEAEEAVAQAEFYGSLECAVASIDAGAKGFGDVAFFVSGAAAVKGGYQAVTGPIWSAGMAWRAAGDGAAMALARRGGAAGATVATGGPGGNAWEAAWETVKRTFSLQVVAAGRRAVASCSR